MSALFAMKVANGEEVVALCAPNFIHYSVEIPETCQQHLHQLTIDLHQL